MSVVSITPDLVEVTTLLLQPSQSFSSSSSGLSGVIRLFSKPSTSILSLSDVKEGSVFSETSAITDDNDLLYSASQSYIAGETNINGFLEAYLAQVAASSVDSKQFFETYPARFTCPNSIELYGSGTDDDADVNSDRSEWVHLQRNVLRRRLIPGQRIENSLSFYSYINYNCLNFVSSSTFGTASAIIYPNFPDPGGLRPYTPDGQFTLDFFIKPKAPIRERGLYRAGTIFHISSSICVSLVSGSTLSQDQKPETYRILLQLSQSADSAPSTINPGSLPLSFPNNLIFATDEVLKRDTWHRVTVRWGAAGRSYGSGSIKVDDKVFPFTVNGATIATKLSSDALVIGNYYDSFDSNAKFFNVNDAVTYGTNVDPVGSVVDPAGFKFTHPLHAELHHVSLFKRYLSDQDLDGINSLYPLTMSDGGPDFFVAPYFTSSVTNYMTYLTPKTLAYLGTDSPVSYHLGAGYNATFLHLQNFVIDFAHKKQPRPYGASEGTGITTPFDSRVDSIDDLLMAQRSNRKRSFSIIPCDDGNFEPNFDMLLSDSTRFQEVAGRIDPAFIDLEQFVPSNAYIPGYAFEDFDYDGEDYGFLPLYQNLNYLARISDVNRSSNLITIFTIPSAYFQTRIIPGTFVLVDSNVSGSGGLSFTIKDDGRGNLYRADANSTHAKWNRIGAIFYGHGIAALISPHIPYFGKTGYEMTFRGETRKSVVNISIPASPGNLNSSFNASYQSFPPTNLSTEQAEEFSYITGINLHDENFNVVMRARLAQAVQKREGDEIVFRLRYDL